MSNNLYEALKAKAAREKFNSEGEIKLDDVTRVKVLSPGRQVMKRFVRNRLAVFGSVVLIILFLFSFVGPLFYPYGQKEIFYKYDLRNVNYALAKENTIYNGYSLDSSVIIPPGIRNMMNSKIKSMIGQDKAEEYIFDSDSVYVINCLGDEVYTVSSLESEHICTVGTVEIAIGKFSTVSEKVKYESGVESIEGLDGAAARYCVGKSGTFSYNGSVYTFKAESKIVYLLRLVNDGITYMGDALDANFEDVLNSAIEAEETVFSFSGDSYLLEKQKDNSICYSIADAKPGMIYSRLTVDTHETGVSVSEDFRANALKAAYGSRRFLADGQAYTITKENDQFIIRTASDDAEFADLSTFSVRRYTGEDSVDYDLKKFVADLALDMQSRGVNTDSFEYNLPKQNEVGEYQHDDAGNLLYEPVQIKITRRDTGEYVLNCDQTIYVIDIFASPSAKHVLGTDGDGFDVLARVMYGGRISLMVGFVVVFLEIILGVIMGGLAGYYGGWVDNLIMRLVDIFYCLPSMPIMIILGAMMDAVRMNTYIRLLIMMAALGIMGWAGVARLVRGQILSLREQEFMVAAEATGIKVKDRIFNHLVPNVMPQLIVIATMGMGGVIIMESTLSFLGLGVKHPLATWGTMINSVSTPSAMAYYPFIWIPVGFLICFTVIAFNFVGDGLRDAYDPKAKR